MNKSLINNIIVGALIAVVFILSYFVIQPILIPIIFGLIFAYVSHPIYRKINKSLKNKTLSAGLLMTLLLFLIIVPIVYLTPLMVEQLFEIFEEIKDVNLADFITAILPIIEEGSVAYSILANLNKLPAQFLNSLTDGLFNAILHLPNLALKTFVFLFTFFFAIRDCTKLKDYAADISPFSQSTERRFLREFRGITNSVVLGQALIGVVQGLALGLGLLLLGVPNVVIWTILTAIVSIIPVVGPWLIWVPVAVYLFVTGDITSAVILSLYGAIIVSNLDNFIRPYLLSRSSKLPLVISLIGTIGGLYFLGIIGIVLGPLILAYALIIIDFYKEGRLNEMSRNSKRGVADYEIKS